MTISLNQVSKRYQSHWILKGIDYTFEAGMQYAILGANGSGKSTLLRAVAGMQDINKGKIDYTLNGKPVKPEHVYRHISYCAPGMDLVEELTLEEFLKFHFSFKAIRKGYGIDSMIDEMGLQQAAGKFIHEFSSGMKQRVKLAQAFFSDTPVLLLDEPCSNLDLAGVEMYLQWLRDHTAGRLVIVASNDEREYDGISRLLQVTDYK
ncbi:ABC transporter ATP-binding protein [Taibaiella chishuiensis]|uniref:ABC transporter family protein n=1 Tax=Taibaiella chishuiensis TaxID=1434707 RepID=A0A2P8CWG2_9BACT|nr:ABC transporter ATP-binding protein [Taibaiella chishuiensis]PSK89269.1 ABC transporter family protein [Taibaiella chishuiensis]